MEDDDHGHWLMGSDDDSDLSDNDDARGGAAKRKRPAPSSSASSSSSSSAAAAAAAAPVDIGELNRTAENRRRAFGRLCDSWNWLDYSSSAKERYAVQGDAYCTICKKSISIGLNSGNFKIHADRKS